MKRLLGLLLVAALAPAAHAADTFDSVFACMRQNLPTSLRTQSFELVSIDRATGQRRLTGRIFAESEQGLLRVMLRVMDPPDLKGSSYLLRETPGDKEDDVYLSLPKVSRVRHITGTQASQSLLATDFSYADVRQIQNAFAGGTGTLEAPTDLDGRKVHVITIEPPGAKASPYSLVRAWVDPKSCVALKTEFYKGGEAIKRLTGPASALTQSDGFWYLSQMEMRDLKAGTRTELKVKLEASEKDMSDRYFNPNSFALFN